MAMTQSRNGSTKAGEGFVSVLIVEDEIDDARFALDALEAMDNDVEVEATPYGERALELLADRSFDCVLLDYRLPRMNGTEFVRELRKRDIDVPVVVLTGRGSSGIAEETLAAGADAHLSKEEGDDESIRETIKQALQTASSSS